MSGLKRKSFKPSHINAIKAFISIIYQDSLEVTYTTITTVNLYVNQTRFGINSLTFIMKSSTVIRNSLLDLCYTGLIIMEVWDASITNPVLNSVYSALSSMVWSAREPVSVGMSRVSTLQIAAARRYVAQI